MRKRLLSMLFWIAGTVVLGTGVYFALNYVLGRNFTPDGIQNTGTIKLNITPAGNFSVLLDEQRVTPVNKEIIDNVLPGEHKISIQQPGFNNWEQLIYVNAGLVTDVTVQLFPQTFPVEQLTHTNVDRVFFSPSQRYIYYVVSKSEIGGSIGVWRKSLQASNIPLIQENAQKLANLNGEILSAIESNSFTLIPSPNDSRVLIQTKDKIFIMPTNGQNTFESSEITSIPYPVYKSFWLNDTNLVIETEKMLLDFNVDTGISSVIAYDAAKIIYAKSASAIIYLRKDNLFTYRPGSNQRVRLENITLPAQVSTLRASSANDNNIILTTKDNTNYFLSINNSLLTSLGKFAIKSASHTLQNLIVEGVDKKYSAIDVRISLARNLIDVRSIPSAIPVNTVESALWSLDNRFLIYLSANKKSLFSADQLGNNNVKIADFTFPLPDVGFGIVFNGSGAVVQLAENPDTSTPNDLRYNLYKIRFTP